MKTTKVTISSKDVREYSGDLVAFLATEIKDSAPRCDTVIEKQISSAHALGDFSGKEGETLIFYPTRDKDPAQFLARRVLVVGLGSTDTETDPDLVRESVRKAGGTIAKISEKTKAKAIMVSIPFVPILDQEQISQYLTEGILLGDYRFTKYKKPKENGGDYPGIETLALAATDLSNRVRKGIRLGSNAAQAACEARDMANEPGNGWTAGSFADHARNLAKTHGFSCRVIEKEEMKTLGMGGLLAVNQGSVEPPKLVILEYNPPRKTGTLLLVGKGITFDSGGVSLKQAEGMGDMKYDMSGGAAVLALMEAVGREKPRVGVVVMIPATDNMGGGGAVKPGDVIRHFNGVTSEILNTDAEGRMVLADALAYGIETYKPDHVIDIATLTGAMMIALGHHYSGFFSTDETLAERLTAAGKRAGEPLWRMPLAKEYAKQIESTVADIKNMGGRPGGAITAAAYLQNFVGSTPWAHIDIAGTAWDFTEKSYIPKGPSGIGVRTFLELIRSWKKPDKN
ncbi:MAG: leucyl aminopeptidase [Pseudomonadota bacterium]